MQRLFCFFIILFFVREGIAQKIKVIDHIDQKGIPGVVIRCISNDEKRLTNNKGEFSLEHFKLCDSLQFYYPGYERITIALAELKKYKTIELFEDRVSISETVVSASRWKSEKRDISAKIVSLNMKKLSLLDPQTTADLLETSGSVFIQKSQQAGGSPQLRGFGANRVMIVVDGVRMNHAIFRSGNLQNVISIDPNALENVEVLFGPGAVNYGSDAIGGVMHFKTVEPSFSLDSTLLVKLKALTRYSSANNELTGNLSFKFGKQKWATFTSLSYSDFDDLLTGRYGDSAFLRPVYQTILHGKDTILINKNKRLQLYSGYSQMNAIQKIRFKISEKQELEYTLIYSTTSNAPRYDRLTQDKNQDGILDKAEWYYGPQKWLSSRLMYHIESSSKLFEEFRLTLAFQQFKESRHDRNTGSAYIRRRFEKVNAYSLNLDLKKNLKNDVLITCGAEVIDNDIFSRAYKENIHNGGQQDILPRYPNGSHWNSLGSYFSVRKYFNEKWTLNSGVRYNYYYASAKFDTTLFPYPEVSFENQNDALNGQLGMIFNSNKDLRVYMNLSTGFRAPNIDDLGKVFDSEPGTVIVPNVHLKPEYAYNVDFGFVKYYGNQLKIETTIYGTYLKNAIVRDFYTYNGQDSIFYDGQMSRVMALQNGSHAYVYGAQFQGNYFFSKNFSFSAYLNYQKGYEWNIDSARYFPKPHIMPFFLRSELSYQKRKLKMVLYFNYQAEMEYEDLPLLERYDLVYAKDELGRNYTPEWYTLNFKVLYYVKSQLSLTAGVENITNRLYRTFGSGISAQGRNFRLAIRLTL